MLSQFEIHVQQKQHETQFNIMDFLFEWNIPFSRLTGAVATSIVPFTMRKFEKFNSAIFWASFQLFFFILSRFSWFYSWSWFYYFVRFTFHRNKKYRIWERNLFLVFTFISSFMWILFDFCMIFRCFYFTLCGLVSYFNILLHVLDF